MKPNLVAYIYAFGAVLCWSTVASAFKIGLSYLSVLDLLFFASLTAAFILFCVLSFQKKLTLLLKIPIKSLPLLVLMGIINPFAYYLVLFSGYDRLPAQIAQPLNYTWPIVLTLLSALIFKHKVPARKYIGMGISFVGVGCVSMAGSSLGTLSVTGIILTLFSAFIWASFWILNIKSNTDRTLGLFISFCFSTLISGIIYLIGWESAPPIKGVAASIYIGTFEMAIPFVLWGIALQKSTKQYAVNQLSFFSPFISLIFISYILHEPISSFTIVGLLLIVSGVIFNQYTQKKQ